MSEVGNRFIKTTTDCVCVCVCVCVVLCCVLCVQLYMHAVYCAWLNSFESYVQSNVS